MPEHHHFEVTLQLMSTILQV